MQTGAELEHGEIDKTITYGRIYLFLVHIKMKKLLAILVLGLLLTGCDNRFFPSGHVKKICAELIPNHVKDYKAKKIYEACITEIYEND